MTHEWLLFAAVFIGALALLRIWFSIQQSQFKNPVRKEGVERLFRRVLTRFVAINALLPIPRYRKKVEKLLRDGRQASVRFEEFLAMQEGWALLTPAVLYLLGIAESGLLLLAAGIFGFMVPYMRLDGKIKKIKNKIAADLPFMIDILGLSIEAGANFKQAVGNIVSNFPDRPLKEELRFMLKNLEAGDSIVEALTRLRDRVNVQDVASLCSALVQADQMGTGLAVTLKQQSDFIKKKQFEMKREKAKRAATLMVIPLLLFIFPAMFLVILGPVAIKLYLMLFAA